MFIIEWIKKKTWNENMKCIKYALLFSKNIQVFQENVWESKDVFC